MKGKLFLFLLVGLIFSMAGMQSTWAMPVELELDYRFSEPPSPGSPTTPWATAVFERDIKEDVLKLTMTATNLLLGEFIGQWYFNFDDAIDATDLFSGGITVESPGVGIESLGIEQNFYKAGGDGYYDMLFDFQKDNSDPLRFTGGEQVIVSFGLDGLEPEDFKFLSSPTSGKKLLKVEEDIKKAEEKIEELKKEVETAKKKIETETKIKEIEKLEKEIEKAEQKIEKEEEKIKLAEESESDEGLFYSAVHIQGIGTNDDSAWVGTTPVPESPTLLLVGIGLIGLAGFGRRRLKT